MLADHPARSNDPFNGRASDPGAMTATRVLVVDDETPIVELIRGYLEAEGMDVAVAQDGPSAVEAVRERRPDVVVLDVMLPGFDGFEVLRRVRTFSDAYVIMLTARAEEIDRIVGLSVGADDYLVKPFRMEELVARLRAILRRTAGHASPVLRAGAVELDTRTRAVSVAGRETDLTALEYRLLAFLLHRQGQVVAAGELLDHLHGSDSDREANALEALLTRLRRKLGPGIIETRRGHGYLVPADPPGSSA